MRKYVPREGHRGGPNVVAEAMASRRSPRSINEIAMEAGTSEQNTRRYLTERDRLDNWLRADEKVVVLHGNKGEGNSYCVRTDAELNPQMRFGRKVWTLTTEDPYKAHYAR